MNELFEVPWLNTAAVLAVLVFLLLGFRRMERRFDTLEQTLFGHERANGRDGVLARLECLEDARDALPDQLKQTRHEVANNLTTVLGEMEERIVNRIDQLDNRLRAVESRR